MKTQDSLTKICFISAILALFLTQTGLASTQIASEFWISTNATGNIYPNGGTLDNPLDGSTASNFDENMSILCNGVHPNSTIHILAGTYQTKGAEGWQIRSVFGQRILGSGMDVTILTLIDDTNDPEGWCIQTCCGVSTNLEIADMTINANYTGGAVNRHGIGLDGTEIAVRRVKVINCGFDNFTNNSEAWGISIGGYFMTNSVGNIIEDSEVSQFQGPLPFITAISIGDAAGIMRDNRVFLSPVPGEAEQAFGPAAGPILVEGNYVDGADSGVYGDTGGCTNILIAHNNFVNCQNGVTYYGAQRRNITIAFNNITLAPDGVAAINIWNGGDPNVSITNVVITGNTIDVAQPISGTPDVIAAQNVTGLQCYGNTINGILASNQVVQGESTFIDNTNVHAYDNYDLFGNLLTDFIQPACTKSFNILPPSSYVQMWGTGSVNVGLVSPVGHAFFGWDCSSNANASIFTALPLPNDYWGGKTTYVTTWNIWTTNAGTYVFTSGNLSLYTNGTSDFVQENGSFIAPAGANVTTIAITNTISTPFVEGFQAGLYLGDQVQPGNYAVLSGKVTAQ